MKIFKKVSLIVLIILLSIVNYTVAQNYIPKNDSSLIEAFESTEANLLQTNINYNGIIQNKFIKFNELEDISKKVIDELGIVGNLQREDSYKYLTSSYNAVQQDETYRIEKTESLDLKQITVWGKDKNGRMITVILLTERDPYEDFQQTNLFIDVIQNNDIRDIEVVKNKIEKIFNKFNSKTENNTCIIGTFDGQLSSEKKIEKISQAIGRIQGSKVEGLIDPSVVSFSIYTPNIDRYIYTGNNKMNLNISMRYNEYEGKTYIWMGTPIITVGY